MQEKGSLLYFIEVEVSFFLDYYYVRRHFVIIIDVTLVASIRYLID